MFGPLTEPETDFPTRSTEPDNELTRARVMGRDNRDLGGASASRGGGGWSAGVSRGAGGERGEERAWPQVVARNGVETKKAQGVGLGLIG